MSANPEAFKLVRESAYRFVQTNGKGDRQRIHQHCTDTLQDWSTKNHLGEDLSTSEMNRLANSVTNWVVKRYNIPKKKPLRRREERAAAEMAMPALHEMCIDMHGHSSIRKTARIADLSKSTVARHLRQQGIAPVRQKRISKLPLIEQRLVEVLDQTFPRDGTWLLFIDDLAAALWDIENKPAKDIARSTRSTRRKKLRTSLRSVSKRGIGYHLVPADELVAVRRGRRFEGYKEIAIWIEKEKTTAGIRPVILPKPPGKLFWSDAWLNDVLCVLSFGVHSCFYEVAEIEPLLRLARPLLDPTPLFVWLQRASNSWRSDDFASNLNLLADKISDGEVRRAAERVASIIMALPEHADCQYVVNYFDDADDEVGFMALLRDVAPESHARCAYLRNEIFGGFSAETTIWEALDHCRKLRDQEVSGEWAAPTAECLEKYLPADEPELCDE